MPLPAQKFRDYKHKDLILTILSFTALLVTMFLTDLFENIWIYALSMFFALALIVKSSDIFLTGAKSLAKRVGVSEFVIGLTIVSIGTSVPEIASTGMAAYHHHADLAIGNIYGSVLVQITLVLGIVVLFCPVETEREVILRDGLCMLGAVVVLTLFTARDRVLQRWQGAVLISLYIIYLLGLFIYYKRRKKSSKKVIPVELDSDAEGPGMSLLLLLLGLGFVVFSAARMVESADFMAVHFELEESIIGTVITAFGTSIPELAVAIVAVKKARALALGTLIGSNITDPLLSIGIAGVINPIWVSEKLTVYHFLVPVTLVACVVALWFMRTDFKVSRWEGTSLIVLYLLTIVGLFLGWHIVI